MQDQTIKVLIVDDSRVYRSFIEGALKRLDNVEITGSVFSGDRALKEINRLRPDIVTLDVEMPVMDGLETLEAIQQYNAETPSQQPIDVIMVSAFTKRNADITLKALAAGAFDFILKPVGSDLEENVERLTHILRTKLHTYRIQKKRHFRTATSLPSIPKPVKTGHSNGQIEAVVIGVSTGGPKALMQMMPELCRQIDLPIFIVQHMPETFTRSLAENLNTKCIHTVVEASNNMEVESRHAYVAPGGQHMLIKKSGHKTRIAINDQPPENGCKPAVDVLFRSAAQVYREKTIAVVMTGMGSDGTKGLGPLKRCGAYVVVQDEASSVVWGMPGSAVAAGCVDEVVSLMAIPNAVGQQVSGRT